MTRSPLWLAAVLVSLACSQPAPKGPDCTGDNCDAKTDAGAPPKAFCEQHGGAFPEHWISGGPDCATEPALQVHRYDADTFILRQSLCSSGEAPFLYLLFGKDRVLMEDTGDNRGQSIGLPETVVEIIQQWLGENGKDAIELVIVNSHAHGDHTGFNEQMAAVGTVVGFDRTSISNFFGITDWPRGSAAFDLGERIIDVLPIPGHEDNHIALYDRRDGLLLTGDTLYPGRLFIRDFPRYKESIKKLLAFTQDSPVCHVLGTHIELTQSGQQYDFDVDHHPDEHALELSRDHLIELDQALDAMGDTPEREAHSSFVVFPVAN